MLVENPGVLRGVVKAAAMVAQKRVGAAVEHGVYGHQVAPVAPLRPVVRKPVGQPQ